MSVIIVGTVQILIDDGAQELRDLLLTREAFRMRLMVGV